MRRARPLALPAGLLLALVLGAACGSTPRGGATARELDALFTDLHARGLFDGAVVVARGDSILFEGGYGFANHELGIRFTPDTPADSGSLAKTFTAALVLMLAAEGKLDLDAPVRRLVPELPYAEPTPRHLLSHTSGLVVDYGFFDAWIPAGEVRTTAGLATALARAGAPLAFAPGSRFEYCSLGYDLAALAAARAAGTSVEELFRARIFRPLGMGSAFLRPGRFAEWPVPRTRGYRRAGDRIEPHDVFDLEAFHGGSNVYLSARDLQRWNASFLSRPPLDEATLARGLAPAQLAEGASGLSLLSWYSNPERTAFWYSGHLEGFHDEVFRDLRTGTSVAYVSNHTLEPWLQHAIVRAAWALAEGRPAERLVAPPLADLATPDLADLAGAWRLADDSRIVTEIEADALWVRSAAGVRYHAFPAGPRSLYVPGLDLLLGAARSPAGALDRLWSSSKLATGRAQRLAASSTT